MVVLVCPHCRHRWDYTGKLRKPQCPRCNKKVSVIRDRPLI